MLKEEKSFPFVFISRTFEEWKQEGRHGGGLHRHRDADFCAATSQIPKMLILQASQSHRRDSHEDDKFASIYVLGRTIRLSPSRAISTFACWPFPISPLKILSARPVAICLEIRRFRGLAPYRGSWAFSTGQSLTSSSSVSLIRRSSSLNCNSFKRISKISLKADLDRRRKK